MGDASYPPTHRKVGERPGPSPRRPCRLGSERDAPRGHRARRAGGPDPVHVWQGFGSGGVAGPARGGWLRTAGAEVGARWDRADAIGAAILASRRDGCPTHLVGQRRGELDTSEMRLRGSCTPTEGQMANFESGEVIQRWDTRHSHSNPRGVGCRPMGAWRCALLPRKANGDVPPCGTPPWLRTVVRRFQLQSSLLYTLNRPLRPTMVRIHSISRTLPSSSFATSFMR